MRVTGSVESNATALNKQLSSSVQEIKTVHLEENVARQESGASMKNMIPSAEQLQQSSNDEETKAKVQDVVDKMNKMLEVNHNTAKFKYHEGLDRYYVTVVDRDTDEVIKEIPPKKLLDAFYEMQKMFGMIVDEKI